MNYFQILGIAVFGEILCSFILNFVGNRFIEPYRNINPPHKKMYVIKNFIKSLVLGFFTFNYSDMYKMILNNKWDNDILYSMTILYVMNDITGLIIVNKNLPTTTKIHHVCVAFLGYFSLKNDYTQDGVMRLVFLNAYFSSMAFLVNLFLAVRVVYPKRIETFLLSIIALYNYIILCIINWSIHYYMFFYAFVSNNFDKNYMFYFIIFHIIMRDDLVLMGWLKNFVS